MQTDITSNEIYFVYPAFKRFLCNINLAFLQIQPLCTSRAFREAIPIAIQLINMASSLKHKIQRLVRIYTAYCLIVCNAEKHDSFKPQYMDDTQTEQDTAYTLLMASEKEGIYSNR